jgi:hypothetical protein
MCQWIGWTSGYVGHAWLNGELSTAELHTHCTGFEYLRAQHDRYVERLVSRYDRRDISR